MHQFTSITVTTLQYHDITLCNLLSLSCMSHPDTQLLDEGADIHAIAPKRSSGGSALAEAISGKHEALVELLLRHGADPFTENPAGKTPLDLALEARAVNIVRACERQALFAGHVSTRVSPARGRGWGRGGAAAATGGGGGGAAECRSLFGFRASQRALFK